MASVWACESCSKTFSRKGDLARHMHLHTGHKPYICRDCGKAFAQFSGMKTHRNVHTKAKPFACGLDGCTAIFGDPSSCNRHRKERHQTIGAYQCPVSQCKSSIKRRSAFTKHLRKHRIDPDTIDINALAPTLIPRQTFARRKPKPSSPIDFEPRNAMPDILYSNAYDARLDPYTYNPISHAYTDSYATDNWLSTRSTWQSQGIPADGLYTISAPPSPPALDFSFSPSPTPSHYDTVRTPEKSNIISRPPSANHLAPHSFQCCSSPRPSLSPLSRLSPLYSPEQVLAGHNYKQPNHWDVNSLLEFSYAPI